jgi:hypothetical protein
VSDGLLRQRSRGDLAPDLTLIRLEIIGSSKTLRSSRATRQIRKEDVMNTIETNEQLVDLGDAVLETKGTEVSGQIDLTGGYRKAMGLSSDD